MAGKKGRKNGHWQDFNNLREILERIVKEIGHFPTQRELANSDYSHLNHAIAKFHGGIANVREKLGYRECRKPNGFLQVWDNFRSELEIVVESLGHFPSHTELSKANKSSLSMAINKYHGGIESVKERMGYAEPQAGSLLEQYVGGNQDAAGR